MKISNILSSIAILVLLSACSSKTAQKVAPTSISTENEIEEIISSQERVKKDTFDKFAGLTYKEVIFLEILKDDTYSSLCGSKDEYLNILNLANTIEKSKKLEDLFYTYTNNLSNSCIDQSTFKKELKKSKYKKVNQDYEVYNLDINKNELLKKYHSDTPIKDILKTYTPKHPQFFALIKELNNNTSLSQQKQDKLKLNIERLKLLKYSNSDNFIQLNVPTHDFTFYEEGKKTKSFGTVVGAADTQTPILSSKLAYFIVNPTWNIPDSIAKSSIIPKALKDRNYLKKKNIVIRKNYKLSSKKIKWKDVNWKKYLKKNVRYIPYKFIQLPSRTNGMGRMKFIFPNDYAVYMHDTIGTWRFKSSKEKIRFVSHGCIRLEHPISLMKYLSENYTKYSYKKVRSIFDKEKTDTIRLNKKLPIHLTYQTVEVKNGNLSFYKDIYGYDKIQKLNF